MSLTIQLEPAIAEAVQEIADEQRRTAEEVVCDVLGEYFRTKKPKLPPGVGKYRSGRSDVSTQARQILRDATKEGQWP